MTKQELSQLKKLIAKARSEDRFEQELEYLTYEAKQICSNGGFHKGSCKGFWNHKRICEKCNIKLPCDCD